MPRQTVMYCHEADGRPGRFTGFYPNAFCVRRHDATKTVFKVLVSEDAPSLERDRHWGWWDTDTFHRETSKNAFTHVYPHQMLLGMCFSCGTAPEEKRGRGLRLPVTVEVLGEVPEGENY
jgi:hypothetical protein